MGPIISGGITPYYRRMMIFVDGTNFLTELHKELHEDNELNVNFRVDKPPAELLNKATDIIKPYCHESDIIIIRKYWFASYQGSDEFHSQYAENLRKNDFEPMLFKKRKTGKEKGVDIALAKEMLVNSFNKNFDIGFLIAGDEDYVELVREVKRYGVLIWGAFFTHGLSKKLKIELDRFIEIVVKVKGGSQ
jgi:uncharacterized LabA/DUF88 family protein